LTPMPNAIVRRELKKKKRGDDSRRKEDTPIVENEKPFWESKRV